ncbi:AlbA family DNA-binding domain-containing protein [Desulfobacula sp.]
MNLRARTWIIVKQNRNTAIFKSVFQIQVNIFFLLFVFMLFLSSTYKADHCQFQIKAYNQTISFELKQDLSSPKSVMKSLVAFANTAGGRLIVGVTDDRRIRGVEDPLLQEERLCSMIADSIAPRLVPNIEMITIEVMLRLGSTNRQADQELIAELRRSVEGIAFDEMSMPDLSIDDIDTRTVAESVREKFVVDETKLRTLKLLAPHQGRLVPSKGAVILFGRKRLDYFSDVWVQCGRFTGVTKADIFDHIELYDHLPMAVGSIMLFLKKHAMRGADFSNVRRKDVWSIPLGILREAVINALVHADYSQRGGTGQGRLF